MMVIRNWLAVYPINFAELSKRPTDRPQAISLGLTLQNLPPQVKEIEPALAGFVRLAAPL